MVVSIKLQVPSGTSLRSLVTGFVLTQRTDGKSPRTVEYYEENLKRFVWYADTKGWPDDARQFTEWHKGKFLTSRTRIKERNSFGQQWGH
jgi:hypothetical protein